MPRCTRRSPPLHAQPAAARTWPQDLSQPTSAQDLCSYICPGPSPHLPRTYATSAQDQHQCPPAAATTTAATERGRRPPLTSCSALPSSYCMSWRSGMIAAASRYCATAVAASVCGRRRVASRRRPSPRAVPHGARRHAACRSACILRGGRCTLHAVDSRHQPEFDKSCFNDNVACYVDSRCGSHSAAPAREPLGCARARAAQNTPARPQLQSGRAGGRQVRGRGTAGGWKGERVGGRTCFCEVAVAPPVGIRRAHELCRE
jgi:hypothetical protein